MPSCDSVLALLLSFLSRRLDRDDVSCDAEGFDSGRILRDYVAREVNLLLWFGLVGVTALLVGKLGKLFRVWRCGARIPGPPCPSFYGHSVLFQGDSNPHGLTDLLVRSHERYGSIVKLWLSPTQLLVSMKEPSHINEMLSTAADKVPLTGRVYRLAFGPSSFFVSSFEKVQRGRESLAMELNGNLLEKANLMTDRVLDSVMERISEKMDKGTLDCGMFSQHMAFSILGATLFGDAFFAWSKADVYEELILRIAKDACFWASYSVPPFWKRGYWRYQHLCTKLKSLTQDIIQQCRTNCKMFQSGILNNSTMRGSEAEPDMTYIAAVKLEKSSPQEPFGHLNLRDEPCGNVMGLMFHGCLTTTALIGNILARLVLHPEIQEKIYLEIVTRQRQCDKRNKQDIHQMHLLLATVYESARLLPAGPLLQRCSLNQDLVLKNGLCIPSGAMLVAPIQLVQTDESNWGSDAGQFNPYRFLSKADMKLEQDRSYTTTDAAGVPPDSEDGSYTLKDPLTNSGFLPFGSGIRACVGQKFTVLGIVSIFASLLERYEIRPAPGSGVDPKPLMVNCVLQLVPSPKIVFVPRSA